MPKTRARDANDLALFEDVRTMQTTHSDALTWPHRKAHGYAKRPAKVAVFYPYLSLLSRPGASERVWWLSRPRGTVGRMSISETSITASEKYDQVCAAYECYDHQHSVAILTLDYPDLFGEICDVLLAFRFLDDHVMAAGGNESQIPKTFSEQLRPLGWRQRQLTAKLVVDEATVSTDTHLVDYVKGEVALDLEWNSKDQTFDRDLYAFRAFFEYRKVGVGVLITRSDELQPYFASLGTVTDRYGAVRPVAAKYGAATTHMGKLLPRLKAGRSGGCPVLAIGITRKQRGIGNG